MRVISHSVAFPFLYPFPVVPVLFSPVDAPLPSSVLFRGLMRCEQVLRWPAIHQLHQHGLAFPSISLAWLFLPSALPGFPFQSEWAGLICLPSSWPGFPFHQHDLAFPSISMAWFFLPSAWPGFPFHQHGLGFPSISMAWLSSLPSAWPGFLPFHQHGLAFFPFHQHGLAFFPSVNMAWLFFPSISLAWLSLLSAGPGFPFLYPFQVPPLPQSLHFYPSTLSSSLLYCSEC